jgi:hypothetical protein
MRHSSSAGAGAEEIIAAPASIEMGVRIASPGS